MSSIQNDKLLITQENSISLESDALTEPREETINLLEEPSRALTNIQEVNVIEEPRKKEEVCKIEELNMEEGETDQKSKINKIKELNMEEEKTDQKGEVNKIEELNMEEEKTDQKGEVNKIQEACQIKEVIDLKDEMEIYKKEEEIDLKGEVNKIKEVNQEEEEMGTKGEINKTTEINQKEEEKIDNKGEVNKIEEINQIKEVNCPSIKTNSVNYDEPSLIFTKFLTKTQKRRQKQKAKAKLRSQLKIQTVPAPNVSESKDQPSQPSHRADLVPKPPPSFSAPCAKRPGNSEPHRPYPSYNSKAESCKVTIMPVDYPAILLTSEQAEEIRDQLTSKLDHLDVDEGLQPEFSGFGFKSGVCILTCDNQASKDWLVSCVESLSINSANVKLRIGSLQDINRNVKVGIFFTGRKVPDDLLLKRLMVQNSKVPDIKKWIIVGGKEEAKGFFGILRIPETSFRYLESQNLVMSYGMSKVTVKYLDKKKQVKEGGFKQARNPEKGGSISLTPEVEGMANATRSCNVSSDNKVTYSSVKGARTLRGSSRDNSRELGNYGKTYYISTKPNRVAGWESESYGGTATSRPERGSAWEPQNYCGPTRSRLEQEAAREPQNYDGPSRNRTEHGTAREPQTYDGPSRSRPERGAGREPQNYGGPIRSRPERGSAWESDHYEGPARTRPERTGAPELGNYDRPVSTRPGRVVAREFHNYGGPARILPETPRAWDSGNYVEPTDTRLETAKSWELNNYGESASTRPERAAARESHNYDGPGRILPETSEAWESASYGKPVKPSGWEPGERDRPRRQRELGDQDGPSRKRPERRGGWELGDHDRPAKVRPERVVGWEADDHNRFPRTRPEKSKWESSHQDGPPRTRHERVGGWESGDDRTARTRPETIGRELGDHKPAWERSERTGGRESAHLDGPARTRTERAGNYRTLPNDFLPARRS